MSEAVYTLRVRGRLHDYTPGLPAFDLPDGEHKLYTEQQVRAMVAAQAAPGWQLVPVEPTKEMLDAYVNLAGRFQSGRSDWEAMVAAAPTPPAQERKPLTPNEVSGLLESAGYWPGDMTRADFINGLRYGEMAHGIGATNAD